MLDILHYTILYYIMQHHTTACYGSLSSGTYTPLRYVVIYSTPSYTAPLYCIYYGLLYFPTYATVSTEPSLPKTHTHTHLTLLVPLLPPVLSPLYSPGIVILSAFQATITRHYYYCYFYYFPSIPTYFCCCCYC